MVDGVEIVAEKILIVKCWLLESRTTVSHGAMVLNRDELMFDRRMTSHRGVRIDGSYYSISVKVKANPTISRTPS